MSWKDFATDPIYKGILPKDFLHGYASAAYQIEGGASEGGRGPCEWDKALKDYPEDGERACNSYDLWEQDIELLKRYGAKSYRFSISWSRVKPLGGKDDPINEEGIAYYDNLIGGLVNAGIEPTITLLHYDCPLELAKRYRGFAAVDATQLIEDFVSYAILCFETFGDRVKRWLTINEPWIYCAHAVGLIENFQTQDLYRVGHNSMLVHAYAVEAYRTNFRNQKGKIGIALNNDWVIPLNDTAAAIEGAQLSIERSLAWFARPIFHGTQTTAWLSLVPNFPQFTPAQLALLHGSADFFSINHYGTTYATGLATPDPALPQWLAHDGVAKTWTGEDGKPIGKRGQNGHPHIVPRGFHALLMHCWKEYAEPNGLQMIVYENGFPVEHEADMPLDQIVDDRDRQEFYAEYVKALCDAVKKGAKIEGYHGWSLLDNLEWYDGYRPRFGVTNVDPDNGFKRTPKKSAWYLKALWEHLVAKE